MPRSPTNINPHSQRIVWVGILKHQAQYHVAAKYYVVYIAGVESVCTFCASTVKHIHPKQQKRSVYIWCHNASEHLLSQCRCTSGVTMPVNTYCHNVSVHLVSQCQQTSTVTMSIYIYCNNVSVYVASQFLLSVPMSVTLLLITILYSRYLSTKQRHQYVFTIKESTDQS